MYGYIYKQTNLINGKIYIGLHKASKFEPERYLGSGSIFKAALAKYGKENFICELLDTADSIEELNNLDKYYIKLYDAKNKTIGYNISDGGTGTLEWADTSKKKLSEYIKNSVLVNDGKKCIRITKSMLEEYLMNGYKKGVLPYKRSESCKDKIRQRNTGKVAVVKDGIRTRVDRKDLEKYLEDSYQLGWALVRKTYYISKRQKGSGPARWMHKDGQYVLVPESGQKDFIANGYIFGNRPRKKFKHKNGYKISEQGRKNLSEAHKGLKQSQETIDKKRATMKNYVTINKDGKTKKVDISKLDIFLSDGWEQGGASCKNPRSRKVICIDTNEIFDCIKHILDKYPNAGYIRTCLKSKKYDTKCNGKYWAYLDDNDRINYLRSMPPEVPK